MNDAAIINDLRAIAEQERPQETPYTLAKQLLNAAVRAVCDDGEVYLRPNAAVSVADALERLQRERDEWCAMHQAARETADARLKDWQEAIAERDEARADAARLEDAILKAESRADKTVESVLANYRAVRRSVQDRRAALAGTTEDAT